MIIILQKVIKVKGVGPVTALRVVGSNELEDLTLNSILKVPGVGEKTALNIYNTFNSNQNTKIIKVLVEDGTPVEFGQPLFLVDPS